MASIRKKSKLITVYMGIPKKTYRLLVSKAEAKGQKITRVIREILDAHAA